MAVAAIAAGVTIGSAILGGISGSKERKEASKLMKEEAALIRQESEEDLRRFDIQAGQIKGLGRAKAFASGVKMTGSSKRYLDALSSELETQREYMKETTEQRVSIAAKGGAARLSADRWASYQQTASGLMQGLSYLQ